MKVYVTYSVFVLLCTLVETYTKQGISTIKSVPYQRGLSISQGKTILLSFVLLDEGLLCVTCNFITPERSYSENLNQKCHWL